MILQKRPTMKQHLWNNKRILLTGHTGFKGAWATLWLESLGAKVTGLSLPEDKNTNLFSLLSPWLLLDHRTGDIRDATTVKQLFNAASFDIIIHMAAQSLVRKSYAQPMETFATNIMGTLNILSAANPAALILVITSDKVYRNEGNAIPFREHDPLGGDDPYSASKACAEIAAQCWRQSYGSTLVTARAGNVIGGGDFAEDRLVPDFIRALAAGSPLHLRYPHATRPWQHVLDVLAGYFMYCEHLIEGKQLPPSLNFGPDISGCLPASQLIDGLQQALGSAVACVNGSMPDMCKEKSHLALNSAAARNILGWRPRLEGGDIVRWTADWYKNWQAGQDMRAYSLGQLATYQELL
jgi:CDP-glucose 4,6-dehydratase